MKHPLLLFIPALFFIATDCDQDCNEMRENNYHYLDVHILEATPPFTHFEIVRTIEMSRTRKPMKILKSFANAQNRIVSDGSTLLVDNDLELNFLNFSADGVNNPLFSAEDVLRFPEHADAIGSLDIRSQQNKLLVNRNEYGSDRTQILTFPLADLNPNDWYFSIENEEVVSEHLNEVRDTYYIMKRSHYPRFSASNSDIIYLLVEEHYTYNEEQHPDYPYEDNVFEKYFVLRSGEQTDTLFAANTYSNFYAGTEKILYSWDDSLAILNHDGSEITKLQAGFIKASPTGNSFIDWMYNYVNPIHNISISLHDQLTGFDSVHPFDDIVIFKDSLTLKILDVHTEEFTHEINPSHFPAISTNRNKVSDKFVYFPYLTKEGNLRILYADRYYIDDPYDSCDLTPPYFYY